MMSFKNTVLPDFIIASLYEDSLVQAGLQLPVSSPAHLSGPVESASGMPGLEPVVLPIPAAESKQDPKISPYRYLGKNQKRISIIASYENDPYIPEEHLQFLIKILSACKLNLGDVAILNNGTTAIEINKLKKELNPLSVLLFGPGPADIGLPLNFPLLKLQFFDSCNFLSLPPITAFLEETESAKSLKKQLWDCLKKMFSV